MLLGNHDFFRKLVNKIGNSVFFYFYIRHYVSLLLYILNLGLGNGAAIFSVYYMSDSICGRKCDCSIAE